LLPFLLKQNPSRITCNSHAHFSQTETEVGGKRFKKIEKKSQHELGGGLELREVFGSPRPSTKTIVFNQIGKMMRRGGKRRARAIRGQGRGYGKKMNKTGAGRERRQI